MQIGMMPLIQGHPGTSDVEIYKQELDLASRRNRWDSICSCRSSTTSSTTR